jgi:rubredoxin-NAD+ reductase
MRQYKCKFDDYVYDEAKGDPELGIAPGTRWEDLPADWSCPECGATKEDFDLLPQPVA